MTYNCLIIEDEALLAGVIQAYLEHFPELKLLGICKNPIEARTILQDNTVDLLFLDIHMPHMSGIDFLKSLSTPPAVIFTTAYTEHALEGFELDAVDYLLKPIKMNRFMKAVDKFLSSKVSYGNNSLQQQENAQKKDFITFRSDKKWIKLPFDDIAQIKGEREYVKFMTHSNEKYMTLMSLQELQNHLPYDRFIRVHRSCILAKSTVRALDGNLIKTSHEDVKLSGGYKAEFLDWFLSDC